MSMNLIYQQSKVKNSLKEQWRKKERSKLSNIVPNKFESFNQKRVRTVFNTFNGGLSGAKASATN